MKHAIERYNGFPDGTYNQGHVTTTYDALVATFGEPHERGGDKVNVEWVLLIDGVVVTIHDWKEEILPMGVYDWHIGGSSDTSVEVELVKSAMAPEPFTRFYRGDVVTDTPKGVTR
jgi:hypothetical protein